MKVRLVLSSVLAVLALSAVAASAAQATTPEGPFYKITGTRLASGQSKEVKIIHGHFSMNSSGLMQIECSKLTFTTGAKLLGSTGANFGSGEATIEFSGCTQQDNGSQCEINEGKIKTEPLKLELAFLNKTRTGHLAAILKPATKGHAFAKVDFTGNCTVGGEVLIAGSIAGEIEVAGKPVVVGSEPAAAKTLQIRFPSVHIREAWLEKNGTLTEAEPALTMFGAELSDGGSEMELELAGSATWGIFT
jgi:hypothetical protein